MGKNNKKNPRVGNSVKNKKEKKKSKKKGFSFFSFLLTVILIIILGLCALFGYCCFENDFDLNKSFKEFKSRLSFNAKPVNVLVMGVSTDISTSLADTIMVWSYNPQKQSAYVLSIPRDTFVGNDMKNAKGKNKINSLYSDSSDKRKIINAVEDIVGVKIDYYAVVKTDALVELVDSIGGVNFNVPIDMDYDDVTQDLHIHLKKGEQLIDGNKAEQLLRFRHNNNGTSYPASYGDNDFGRMRTQRDFIKETAKQTIKIGNVTKINKIIGSVLKNVETDMSLFTIVKYIPSGLGFDIESLKSYQLPGESKKLNSLWFFVYDKNKTINLVNELEMHQKGNN